MVIIHLLISFFHGLDMVNRDHLAILCAVEEQGSLTAAAEKLHLTQSALSHSIKKLEHQLGVALFIKEGRQLQFTQAGMHLLNEAKRLLPQFQRLDSIMHDYAKGIRGSLRIGMECHPCYRWLMTVVEPFLQQWPGVDVDVKQRFQFGGLAALFNREIDLLVTPDPVVKAGVSFVPVFDYEQVLVVSEHHAFAQQRFVAPEQLMQERLYTYPVEIERLDIYNQFLLPANITPREHRVIEATEMMLQLVAANRGVATLPRWLVAQYQSTMPIVGVRLGEMGIQKQIFLGTRKLDNADYLRAFMQIAQQAC